MNRVTFWQSLTCARLAVWDEAQRRLLTFREAHAVFARNKSEQSIATH
jgi:omega-6 fatty acid desaturase (delta-12 desaturase)